MASYRSYLEQLAEEIQGYRDFNSRYTPTIDSYTKQYENFNNTNQNWKTAQDINKTIASGNYFDPNTNKTFQQYKKDYTQNAQKAADDTLGIASARTGGLANSYATSVANQTYNNYMQQLANKMLEVEQLERQKLVDNYNRYLGLSDKERAALLSNIEVNRGLRSDEFNQVYTPKYSRLKDAYSAYKDLEALAMQDELIAAQQAAARAAASRSSGGSGRRYDDDDDIGEYQSPDRSDRIWVGGTAFGLSELLEAEAEGWATRDANGNWKRKDKYDSRGFRLNNPYFD